jgi:hypothetical protein
VVASDREEAAVTSERDVIDRLHKEWCHAFDGMAVGDGIALATPFTFPDGDAFPIFLRRIRDGWQLCDDGLTLYQFLGQDFILTEARHEMIERFAADYGFVYRDGTLVRVLHEIPTAADVADIIQLISQILALPSIEKPRESEHIFRVRASTRTREMMADPRSASENWYPAERRGDLFKTDLLIDPGANQPNVAAFFATSIDKADRSGLVFTQYQRWNIDVVPVLVHPGGLPSEAIFRIQTIFGDNNAVVQIDEASSVGYRPLRRRLAELGVALR